MKGRRAVIAPAGLLLVGCTTVLGDFTVPTQQGSDDGGGLDSTAGDTGMPDSSAMDAPPKDAPHESAVRDAEASVEAAPCGALGEGCCAGACADSSLACINDECHSAATGDLGKTCAQGSDCASGVCFGLGSDAGVDAAADAGGAGVCTNACSPDAGTLTANDGGLGDRCLAGWTCGSVMGSSTQVCTCTPSPEVCDGLDNDCDGVIDNGTVGNACDTGKLGVCAAGTSTCNGGVPGCTQNVQPGTEVCDGLDNNCNGQVDEGNPGGGGSCTASAQGACAVGAYTCTSGQIQCLSQNTPSSAPHYSPAANGSWDWNCDGTITQSEPSESQFWGIAFAGCSDPQTYNSICSGLVNSAPVCSGGIIYYHCSAAASDGTWCGETYYYFDCSPGTNYCTFPGYLSQPMSNGCY
jgi:hypothetical protein